MTHAILCRARHACTGRELVILRDLDTGECVAMTPHAFALHYDEAPTEAAEEAPPPAPEAPAEQPPPEPAQPLAPCPHAWYRERAAALAAEEGEAALYFAEGPRGPSAEGPRLPCVCLERCAPPGARGGERYAPPGEGDS